jgi:hypothetical protein
LGDLYTGRLVLLAQATCIVILARPPDRVRETSGLPIIYMDCISVLVVPTMIPVDDAMRTGAWRTPSHAPELVIESPRRGIVVVTLLVPLSVRMIVWIPFPYVMPLAVLPDR